jgi:hypothetical protein
MEAREVVRHFFNNAKEKNNGNSVTIMAVMVSSQLQRQVVIDTSFFAILVRLKLIVLVR